VVPIAVLILRRALSVLLLLWGVVTLSFVLVHAAPGDPISALVGEIGGASPEYIADLRARYGFDQPILVQYGLYLWRVAHLDLGMSVRFQAPVWDLFQERLPATLLLLAGSIAVFSAIGIAAGTFSAVRAGSLADGVVRVLVVAAYSLPVFWLAQLLISLFAVRLGLFPVMGMGSLFMRGGFGARTLDLLWHLALPMTALGAWHMAVTQRFVRTSLLEVLKQDFVRTATAKGLSRRRVLYGHALRHALLPVVTITGISFGTMLTGAALTEIVFGWPGLGRLILDAVLGRDRPLLLGLLLISATLTILVDALTEIVQGLVDPRTRAGRAAR
jgi:peptide/nickel transport system permease protein